MNNNRRKWLISVVERLEVLKDELESISNEEHEAYDNLPDSLKYSDSAEQLEDNVNVLDFIVGNLQDSIDEIIVIVER